MIRIEITCDHAEEPRSRDAKNPCDSTRNRSLSVDVVGTMDDAIKAVRRVAVERGWFRDFASYKAGLVVEAVPSDPDAVQVLETPNFAGQLRRINSVLQFRHQVS